MVRKVAEFISKGSSFDRVTEMVIYSKIVVHKEYEKTKRKSS